MKVSGIAIIICTVMLVFTAFIPMVCAEDTSNQSISEAPDMVQLIPIRSDFLASSESVNPSEQGKTSGSGMRTQSYVTSSVSSVPVDMAGIEWQNMSGGSWGEGFFDIQPTTDGNYIAAGASGSWDMMDDNGIVVPGYVNFVEAWIKKIDPSGKTLWQKLFGARGYDQAMSIRNTPDGGYIFAGFTNSTDGGFSNLNHGKEDGWVVKLDSAGNRTWQTLLGGSENEHLMSVRQTLDNGYIVAGYTESNDIQNAGTYHGNTDMYVAKLNSAGGIVWQKVLGGSKYDFGSSIIPASDGGYILTGYTQSDDIPGATKNHGYYDILVMKLDNSGNPLWTKLIGGNGGEATSFDNVIQPTLDGGYILTGQTTSSSNGDVGTTHGSADVWVVKLYTNGTIQWQNMLGGTGYDSGAAIQQTPHGDYILVGRTTSSNSGDVGQNNGGWDIWVAKLDSTGKLLWQDALGGSAYDQCTAILPILDEGFIFAGFTESSNSGNIGTNHGNQDAWVVNLKPRLVVDVLDSDTHSWVPNATVFLHDVAHNEDMNLSVVNGRAVFSDLGALNQNKFVNGSVFSVKASVANYRDSTPLIVTFSHDGQRVTVSLTAFDRPAIEKSFSITQVGNPGWPTENLADNAEMAGTGFSSHLSENGWTQVFRKRENEVSKEDFGTTGGGLNNATFHFHIGHGGYDEETRRSFLGLSWYSKLYPLDVKKKWGNKNKWVFLDSCVVLKDDGWGEALVTTHGIFGFSTYEKSGPSLVDQFFAYATWPQYRYTLADSYVNATVDMVDDATAKVIFDNEEQFLTDHLPGMGTVAPDENPDDEYYFSQEWVC